MFAFCRHGHFGPVRTFSVCREIAPCGNRGSRRYVNLRQPVAGKDAYSRIDTVRRVVIFCILHRIDRHRHSRIRIGSQPDIPIGPKAAFHVRHRFIGKLHDPCRNDRDCRRRTLPFILYDIRLEARVIGSVCLQIYIPPRLYASCVTQRNRGLIGLIHPACRHIDSNAVQEIESDVGKHACTAISSINKGCAGFCRQVRRPVRYDGSRHLNIGFYLCFHNGFIEF